MVVMYYVISWSPINSEQRYLVTQNWQSNIQVQVEIPNIESIAAELLQWYISWCFIFYERRWIWARLAILELRNLSRLRGPSLAQQTFYEFILFRKVGKCLLLNFELDDIDPTRALARAPSTSTNISFST